MADFVSKDTRNPTTGETSQETADRMAGQGGPSKAEQQGNPPHYSAPGQSQAPTKPVGPNIHPVAKGVYGAPIGGTILK